MASRSDDGGGVRQRNPVPHAPSTTPLRVAVPLPVPGRIFFCVPPHPRTSLPFSMRRKKQLRSPV
ncbi:MAG: hypothetical protein CVT77_17995 [Alphaproteobacteria bacterium HGW-Alphaproteobacteria-16]|nr:MAG: hypothetical protein CVT77_17995 [Alphaproteobacteria bacterium HGW-Alphaproteobacteria-16]